MTRAAHLIRIKGASQNNLKEIDLELPHGKLIAVTGVSGSGKSSLAFEVVANEGKRIYLQSLPSFARQYVGRHARPDVADIKGLYPVITLGQRPAATTSRSTVGTLSEIQDMLRLIFARFGEAPAHVKPSRSLFSFNSALGACPACSGLGIQEQISVDKLVADPSKTLREGALVPTLPNGYIMYSQVTVDVLDTVCREHGFSVDVPWQDMTDAQRDVILNGSDRIKVPFGKHSIESRMKWTGMKAKPREEGFYKGMLPIMSDILKRDRNKNILRFVEAVTCESCHGKRLNQDALSVKWRGKSIDQLSEMTIQELAEFITTIKKDPITGDLSPRLNQALKRDLSLLCELGLGHQRLSNLSSTLSLGELQRIRLVNLLATDLSHVLYVFDEPSTGLHPQFKQAMLDILRNLVDKGNTVIVVEHDPDTIRSADWVVEIGPEAGVGGGKVMYSGSADNYSIEGEIGKEGKRERPKEGKTRSITFQGNELEFAEGKINAITGLPGSGKRELLLQVLPESLENAIVLDQKPIGRTPRSNPATYTGMADHIRDLFAKQPLAKELGFKKARFSFNNKGGRCEKCQGAGKLQVGMHYMGAIEITCDHCDGDRFNQDTLKVTYQDKNIAEVYRMSIAEALSFFAEENKIVPYLQILKDLGLGYLQLGQSSNTLSGGEAQRVKLAAVLGKKGKGESGKKGGGESGRKGTWFLLNEPTTGLHHRDVERLLVALGDICSQGHTVICLEYNEQFIQSAGNLIELTAKHAKELEKDETSIPRSDADLANITIRGAETHNLKRVDVSFPKGKLSVVTGLSGSGKSSLVFDTLYAEAQSRYTESLSTYARSFLHQSNPAQAEEFHGLTPTLAISRKNMPVSPRSTVGTLTGMHEKYRYLFSRMVQLRGRMMSASHFSFNHEAGSCPECGGLGQRKAADPLKMALDWTKSINEGAFTHNSAIDYYGNPDGQFVAILREVARTNGFDLDTSLNDFNPAQMMTILRGTGEKVWDTTWHFKTKTREGSKDISDRWLGFANLVENEYRLKKDNKNIDSLKSLLKDEACPMCKGSRMSPEALSVEVAGQNIADLCAMSIDETLEWFEGQLGEEETSPLAALGRSAVPGEKEVFHEISAQVLPTLHRLKDLELGHLSLDRRSSTLSGGEGQRLRIASLLSGELIGMTYVLDEPTIGLHSSNVKTLIRLLEEVRDMGNTVIVVEHDPELMATADFLVEMGPGAGSEGGQVVMAGAPIDFLGDTKTLTSEVLKSNKVGGERGKDRKKERGREGKGERPKEGKRERGIEGKRESGQPSSRRLRTTSPEAKAGTYGLRGVTKNNLRDFGIDFPSGLVALTGPSGSGKTTLTRDVLVPTLSHGHAVNCESFYSDIEWSRVLRVDQRALEGTRTSTVASHSGILNHLQTLYSASPEARDAGLKKSSFSYAHKDGRCEHCKGQGQVKIAMDFLDDIWNPCEKCHGTRYREEVLNVKLEGQDISQVLSLSVKQAHELFGQSAVKKVKPLVEMLRQLEGLGLGHLRLGQTTASLSGGEAQRMKLFDTLKETSEGPILFVLDEPTAGLHQRDIDVLLQALREIVDKGHTVLAVEHNGYFLSQADSALEISECC